MVEEAGAMHVSLNPVTSAGVCKRLLAAAAAEGVALGTDDAKRVAEGCGGDLRTALETLQILCCGKAMKMPAAPASKVCTDAVRVLHCACVMMRVIAKQLSRGQCSWWFDATRERGGHDRGATTKMQRVESQLHAVFWVAVIAVPQWS